MVLVKILKRKDASSLIVALVIAGIISQFLSFLFIEPSYEIASWFGSDDAFPPEGPGWQHNYLAPFATLIMELTALEVIARLIIFVRGRLIALRAKK